MFDPFLTHFLSQNGPFSRQFAVFHGPKRVTTAIKLTKNTCLSLPNAPGSFVVKCAFDPFLTHFCSKNGPFSRYYGILHGPKFVTTTLKLAKHLFEHPKWSGNQFQKSIFFAPGPLVDPPLAPTVSGACCPVTPPINH